MITRIWYNYVMIWHMFALCTRRRFRVTRVRFWTQMGRISFLTKAHLEIEYIYRRTRANSKIRTKFDDCKGFGTGSSSTWDFLFVLEQCYFRLRSVEIRDIRSEREGIYRKHTVRMKILPVAREVLVQQAKLQCSTRNTCQFWGLNELLNTCYLTLSCGKSY